MLSTFHFPAIKVGCESERLPPEMNHKTANFRSFFCCLRRTRVRHVKLRNTAAEITQPSQERVILPNLTASDLDRGGGVGVPDVGGSDLRAGEAAVAHVSHQSAVGGVDVRAQAETVGSMYDDHFE